VAKLAKFTVVGSHQAAVTGGIRTLPAPVLVASFTSILFDPSLTPPQVHLATNGIGLLLPRTPTLPSTDRRRRHATRLDIDDILTLPVDIPSDHPSRSEPLGPLCNGLDLQELVHSSNSVVVSEMAHHSSSSTNIFAPYLMLSISDEQQISSPADPRTKSALMCANSPGSFIASNPIISYSGLLSLQQYQPSLDQPPVQTSPDSLNLGQQETRIMASEQQVQRHQLQLSQHH